MSCRFMVCAVAVGVLFLLPFEGRGQRPERFIRGGNRLYGKGEHAAAEKEYWKALNADSTSVKGRFNLADAQYEQGKYAQAQRFYEGLATAPSGSPATQAASWYNLGNALFKQNKLPECVEAYKQALKLQPKDEDARYNLSEALRRLQKQQGQNKDQNNQNKDQKDKDKDKNQDQQNQNQQNQNQEQKDQGKDQKDRDRQDQQEQNREQGKDQQEQNAQPRQQQGQMSQEDAAQLLKALERQEADTQDKVQKQKAKATRSKSRTNKDW
ncbi:MAG: tetratricopeptide repeat protein [Bacteroides sp.]